MTGRCKSVFMTLLILGLLFVGTAGAVDPEEILDDPVLESRARELSQGIRCLVCQNESIDSSNASLAKELRLLVRERLVAGDSDQAVRDYLTERYGDYVLLEPPVKPNTYLLWFGPLVVLLFGGLAILLFYRRRRGQPAAPPLSAQEEARLARLLDDEPGPGAGPRAGRGERL